ncbi:uncharacterized protein LOC126669247 [Mercurialis annua]|uniref:uncharacterized protein LOC126669247 n=1 Tax=Mercurialis annua TaxID=3986 RepID=UPI002160599F|nr:uncharacterized protein LOC126669247 [Mercurialis annua]
MSPLNGNGTSPIRGGGGGSNGKNYIKHQVSKMDTLAGVAIKYGVEVADIKRLNGLASDLQMFALKTLLIPLPGRHPPSPILCGASADSPGENSLDKTPSCPRYSNVLDSLESLKLKPAQQKASPAMSTLRKYYGLNSSNRNGSIEGTEMAVYRTGSSDHLTEGLLHKNSPGSSYHNLKSWKFANNLSPEDEIMVDYVPLAEAGDGEGEKSVRRRQKSEADFGCGTSEKLLKEETSGSSNFSSGTGKNLAMRPKSASRMMLFSDSEPGWLNSIPVGLGDSVIIDGFRKSSSTPSLHDQENGNSSLAWPTPKWSLKADLQALSTTGITLPIFDGLPKPITGRWSKAALD